MSQKTDAQVLIKTMQELLSKTLTGTLPHVITDTVANTDLKGMAIYAISDATFTTLDCTNGGDSIAGQTLSAGHIWYLPINGTVELATGAVIIYQHTV